jgi:hypothetical protein
LHPKGYKKLKRELKELKSDAKLFMKDAEKDIKKLLKQE